MNVAAQARAAAMQVEVRKDGLSQLQDGSWVLKLKVHPTDMPPALLTAPMGTRYVAAIVEVSDDETPVSPEQQATRDKPAKDKKRWSELPASQQAAIRCNEGKFWDFLGQQKTGAEVFGDIQAAAVVRGICEVRSRKELDTNAKAAAEWSRLDSDYRFWLQHQAA